MSLLGAEVSRHSIYGGIGVPYGSFSGKALAPPVFSGVIPDLSYNADSGTYQTDLSTYFVGATSHSISPSIEAGWVFDTSTGILTVDTDDIGVFGSFTVTGTNTSGSAASNAFTITIAAVADEALSGGFWFDYDRELSRRNKKKRELDKLEEKAEEIKDDLDRNLAIELQKEEQDKQRLDELARLVKLAEKHEKSVSQLGDKVTTAYKRATIKYTYSAMESLERTIRQAREEEDFLIRITLELLN